jgi:hypothetical protein
MAKYLTPQEYGEIAGNSSRIIRLIREHQEVIDMLQIALEAVQERCTHEGAEEYHGKQTGKCRICQCEFMTKHEIDRIICE